MHDQHWIAVAGSDGGSQLSLGGCGPRADPTSPWHGGGKAEIGSRAAVAGGSPNGSSRGRRVHGKVAAAACPSPPANTACPSPPAEAGFPAVAAQVAQVEGVPDSMKIPSNARTC